MRHDPIAQHQVVKGNQRQTTMIGIKGNTSDSTIPISGRPPCRVSRKSRQNPATKGSESNTTSAKKHNPTTTFSQKKRDAGSR
jgi:hypothetical protein